MNSLLVIGNGFDRTVGANTRYSDFFDSDYYKDTREKVSSWCEHYTILCNYLRNDFGDVTRYDFNCWDLLFYLESTNGSLKISYDNDTPKWCDVETTIFNSLTQRSSKEFSWELTKRLVDNYKKGNTLYRTDQNSCVAYFFSFFTDRYKDPSLFYDNLLSDLQQFELNFGRYIDNEMNREDHIYKAKKLAKRLTRNSNGTLFVDSFNYSDFSDGNITIRHINGDCDNPIFGIDLNRQDAIQFPFATRFTKTSRRLDQDSHGINSLNDAFTNKIDNAVVFGHSLNDMDYDYFNYLFTMLHFYSLEVEKMGSIDFVYRVYDSSRSEIIRKEYTDRIYALLNKYESNTSSSNQHVLINLLRFSGKLHIKEYS